MKEKKKVLKSKELVEVKGGTDPDRTYCQHYGTCPYTNPSCYYQQIGGRYIIPCILG